MDTTMTLEEITPGMASEYLARNSNNRNVRQTRVSQYARDMASGNWHVTGEAIKFNGDGTLLDGQHRLLACIKAGTPFNTYVVRNVRTSAHVALDNALPRSVADELKWRGIKDASSAAAIASLTWRWEKDVLFDPNKAPTKSELLPFVDESRAEIIAATSAARSMWVATRIPMSPMGALYLRMRRTGWDDITTEWFNHVSAGSNYEQGDPALLLRNYALRVQATRKMRPNQAEWLAVCVKAANLWLQGKTSSQLHWRRVGPAAEVFPALLGPDDI